MEVSSLTAVCPALHAEFCMSISACPVLWAQFCMPSSACPAVYAQLCMPSSVCPALCAQFCMPSSARASVWWPALVFLLSGSMTVRQSCFCLLLRVLLFGAPADSSVAEALNQAALGVFQSLPGQSSASPALAAEACPGSLQGLLRVVMWGAASLTHAELAAAASQILQLAGEPADDVMVAELSQHIRQVQNAHAVSGRSANL